MVTRRGFLASTSTAAGVLALPAVAAPRATAATDTVSLCGEWMFRADPDDSGETAKWFEASSGPGGPGAAPGSPAAAAGPAWRMVQVPHTWQVDQVLVDHRGVGWYRRQFDVPADWGASVVRVEFEAVFHSARVWVNGRLAGEHLRKGYTAFTLDVTSMIRWGAANTIVVRVDNRFEDRMLPRSRSSDWAHDGGIYRPVQVLVTPTSYVERVDVTAVPDLSAGSARVEVAALVRNQGTRPASISASLTIEDESTGRVVVSLPRAATVSLAAGQSRAVPIAATIQDARLWHFDHPHLYRARVEISGADAPHAAESTFGVRSFEIKGESFYLNGERVRLMGVERMAGSNPEFGMAEPSGWIEHDHADMLNLNCTFTRVHWPQDTRVLDYCDRHGILIQTEVPTWGPDTFKDMKGACDADIMQNGLEQLREMIARDRNHPCLFAWGLCNEIGGQHPAAYDFAKNMLAEAKKLDPSRPCTYASHSLFTTPGKDVAALMDFVEFNQYFGSWQKGDERDLAVTVDRIHAEIPGKPVVISEYGYCACTADRPEGDQRRREVLVAQTAVLRERDWIAGLIFFCYNDYRTHVGDRGRGAAQQRVHGVVDLYGTRKPSYELLRNESSPVESVRVTGSPKALVVTVRARNTVPAHLLRGYSVRAICFGQGGIPVERLAVALPDVAPGGQAEARFTLADPHPLRVQIDVLRPTGHSVRTVDWQL
jgi:beta-glucuronidase